MDLKSIKPNKRLGQNFLVDKGAVFKIVETANISKNDVILEIGPGTGLLTKELVKKAKKVIAIEKDKKMADILNENLKDCKNIEIIIADILKINDFSAWLSQAEKYKVVANIPYYATSPIIRKFLEIENPPELMVLTIQKEVAQRICAKPPNMSILSVSVQFYAEPKIISYISKNSFWPKPKVDSAIIKIIPHNIYNINKDSFFKVVKAGFKQPRKQLVNNLLKGLKISRKEVEILLQKAGIEPKQRPETLSVQNWIRLTEFFVI